MKFTGSPDPRNATPQARLTALAPYIGYDCAAKIGTRLKQSAVALGYITKKKVDLWVQPEEMVRSGTKRLSPD